MGLRVPIVNAPMGGVAGGRLASAVSAAGGLGMVGMGTAGSTSSLHAELPHVTGTFGIGLVDWVMRKEAGLFDAAIAARPVLISVSFGTDLSWVSRVHDAGIAAATQVYNSDEARQAQDAGIDVIVARGGEGGGHGDASIGTLPLLDAVLEVVSVPVLAARIQELFGLTETPRLGGGRVKVLLHLLAPNYRPQQVTDDLASFWANTYPQVRKELRGRYPKHSWPDDPLTARPPEPVAPGSVPACRHQSRR